MIVAALVDDVVSSKRFHEDLGIGAVVEAAEAAPLHRGVAAAAAAADGNTTPTKEHVHNRGGGPHVTGVRSAVERSEDVDNYYCPPVDDSVPHHYEEICDNPHYLDGH